MLLLSTAVGYAVSEWRNHLSKRAKDRDHLGEAYVALAEWGRKMVRLAQCKAPDVKGTQAEIQELNEVIHKLSSEVQTAAYKIRLKENHEVAVDAYLLVEQGEDHDNWFVELIRVLINLDESINEGFSKRLDEKRKELGLYTDPNDLEG